MTEKQNSIDTFLQAKVVCRQLGFSRALSFTIKSKFGNVHSDFSYDEIQCQGNEDTLDSCPHDNSEDCTHEEGAGVVCSDWNHQKFNKLKIRNSLPIDAQGGMASPPPPWQSFKKQKMQYNKDPPGNFVLKVLTPPGILAKIWATPSPWFPTRVYPNVSTFLIK